MVKFADPNYPPKTKLATLRLTWKNGETAGLQTIWNIELENKYNADVKSGILEKYEIIKLIEY